MNTKTVKPAPAPILSKNLSAYKLTKRHQNTLSRWEEMKKYMALAGKTPDVVRLSIVDFSDIDAAVRNQSDGKRQLSDLTYAGVPIRSVERSPQIELVA